MIKIKFENELVYSQFKEVSKFLEEIFFIIEEEYADTAFLSYHGNEGDYIIRVGVDKINDIRSVTISLVN